MNETWDNATVTFYQIKTWTFEESMSAGSLDDEIVSINMIAVVSWQQQQQQEQPHNYIY